MRTTVFLVAAAAASVLLSLPAQAQNLLLNGGLELEPGDFGGRFSVPPDWEMEEGPAPSTAEPGNFEHLMWEGGWHMWYQPYQTVGGFAHLFQKVDGTPGQKYIMTGWALFEDFFAGGVNNLNAGTGQAPTGAPFDDGPVSPTDTFFAMEFLDASDVILAGSYQIELKAAGQPSNTTWNGHRLKATAPPGTVKVQVRASMTGGVLNPLPSPETFKQSFFTDDFSLSTFDGDFNQDGFVDGRDLVLWEQNVGKQSGATLGQGDADGNGTVDEVDYATWKMQFGTKLSAPPIGVVPEPATAWLAAAGLSIAGANRRRL